MLYTLFAQEQFTVPESTLEVLMYPLALTFLAGLIFVGGWWVENRLTKAPWKWLALVPLGWALYMGFDLVSKYQGDMVYSLSLPGKKWMVVHWAAFIIPVLGLVALLLFHFFNHKLNVSFEE